MILTRTPLRISFVGGGTDLPVFYEKYNGGVISCTIDKYVYVMVNSKFDGNVRVSYSKTENEPIVNTLQHDIIKYTLLRMGINNGIEVVTMADIPGEGTGLGSSSSLAVGLLNALVQYTKKSCDLAEDACKIEIEDCKKPIGKQDQYAAAYGGLNYFIFTKKGVEVKRIPLFEDAYNFLNERLMLFYTGITRKSSGILQQQTANLMANGEKEKIYKEMAEDALVLYNKLVYEQDYSAIGEYLHYGWEKKKLLADEITSSNIDDWYDMARLSGAVGGKICGAGGGGFLLLYAEPKYHKQIETVLPLERKDFKLSLRGSEVLWTT